MDINHDLYKVFFYVVQCGSFTKAAEKLYVSQSAITQSVKKLEDELGGKLFIRSKSGVTLTYEGERLYEYIENSIEVLNHAEDIFSQYRDLKNGNIRIACGSTLAHVFLVDKLKKFCEKYPNIKIKVVNDKAYVALKKLTQGECDVVITSLNIDTAYTNLTLHEAYKTQECFFTTKRYYEEIMKNEDNLRDIGKYSFVLPSTGTHYRNIINTELENENIKLNCKYEFSSATSLIDFVKRVGGIGITTKEFIKEELQSGEFIEIYKTVKFPQKSVGVITLNKKLVGKAVNQLVKYLIEE